LSILHIQAHIVAEEQRELLVPATQFAHVDMRAFLFRSFSYHASLTPSLSTMLLLCWRAKEQRIF
jgi:hypothetical protein